MLVAGSLEQARICFRVARRRMEPKGGYDFTDGANRIAIKHPATRTGLRLIGSNPKTAFGLLDTPYALLDECGAWELQAGARSNCSRLMSRMRHDYPPLIIVST